MKILNKSAFYSYCQTETINFFEKIYKSKNLVIEFTSQVKNKLLNDK